MQFFKIISIILHPIFIPIATIYISLMLFPNIGFAITKNLNFIYLILFFSTIFIPLISVLFLIKINLVSSLEMSDYKERFFPLFITSISMFLGYCIIEDVLVLSVLLRDIIIGAIIIVFTSSIISKYWKISLHMLGAGGLVGVLFSLNFLYSEIMNILIFFILISGLLGVARVKEKAHNNIQVYIGFLLGFFIEFYFVLLF